MARSIHTQRKDYYHLLRDTFDGPQFIKEELKDIRRKLHGKVFIKKQRKHERKCQKQNRRQQLIPLPYTPEVYFEDSSSHIHYPISEKDVNDLFEKLPPYILSGLDSITFCLGKRSQAYDCLLQNKSSHTEYDPYTHRHSTEILPGIYVGNILGQYFVSNRPYDQIVKIHIYAYVYEEKRAASELVSCYLKMLMLGTLLHEIAHHHDHTNRTARGRWLGIYEPTKKVEAYADQMQERWAKQITIPLLKANYPEETAIFEEWASNHPLIDVPMHLWISDHFLTSLIAKAI